jgi:hypothetical protein
MILRHLFKHIRTQNWAAVGLDFVVVVVGILIAFQITEWNTARRERQAEQRYLVELGRDLMADVDELKQGQRQTLSRLAVSEGILRVIDPGYERPAYFPELSSDSIVYSDLAGYAYAGLTSTFFVIGTDYTFNELVQSGTLGVLSNRALVNELTAHYGRFKQRREQDRIAYRDCAKTSLNDRAAYGCGKVPERFRSHFEKVLKRWGAGIRGRRRPAGRLRCPAGRPFRPLRRADRVPPRLA